MASLKDSFNLLFKPEPQRSFQKAGVTDGNDVLTSDGQTVFLSYLLRKHGADFNTEVVQEILKQREK